MYESKLAIAIKHNGKVLREHGDICYLPFGCEYTIFLKNLNTVRAKVKITIDGKEATDGVSLIIPANGSVDLERFVKSGENNRGNRFKFIERTAGIEKHRGIGAEDGLIRIEFEFEKQFDYHKLSHDFKNDYWDVVNRNRGVIGGTDHLTWNNCEMGRVTFSSASVHDGSATLDAVARSNGPTLGRAINTAGITVPGSESNQKFQTISALITDGIKHCMVVKLIGETETATVEEPVTVKQKVKCPTCGKKNKTTVKFCPDCGTAVTIF